MRAGATSVALLRMPRTGLTNVHGENGGWRQDILAAHYFYYYFYTLTYNGVGTSTEIIIYYLQFIYEIYVYA